MDEHVKETLLKSVGIPDEFGYFVCPFCNSYAKDVSKIMHTPNCVLNTLGDNEDTNAKIYNNRLETIMNMADDIETIARDIQCEAEKIEEQS